MSNNDMLLSLTLETENPGFSMVLDTNEPNEQINEENGGHINHNVAILNVNPKLKRASFSEIKKEKDLTPFNYTPPKPNSRFLRRDYFKSSPYVLNVYLNILTSCEIPLNPNLTKEDTIIKAMKGFGIDTSTSHLYTLELWIEHKEHKDFVKSIYESWEEYKNTPNVKFHLYRKREPKIEKKICKIRRRFFSLYS